MSPGRPKMSSEDKIGRSVAIRFRPVEMEFIKRLAEVYKMSISKYIRLIALKNLGFDASASGESDAEMRARDRSGKKRSYSSGKQ